MIYVYPERNLRLYPGAIRRTDNWDTTYKIRTAVERSINHFKESFCVSECKTRNASTLHADLLLADISRLLTVLLKNRIHKPEYFRSIGPLIA